MKESNGDVFTFGKFVDKPFEEAPATYLRWIIGQGNDFNGLTPELKQYLADNEEAIMVEADKEDQDWAEMKRIEKGLFNDHNRQQ